MTRALVVFSGKADLLWLRLLRPGFRHCFILLHLGDGWVCINPLAHRTSVEVWTPEPGQDLPGWLRSQDGLTVIETEVRNPPHRPSPLGLYSCVEAVKRVLGLQERWVLTPAQLHDFLTRCGKKSLTSEVNRTNVQPSTPEPCPNYRPTSAEGFHSKSVENKP
ncbi:hypothetical protein [Paramagnetospirillum magneticum]|uniref:Uncharacterized protein n=1 Tax=Paramagnetospirillum magneticum (strain ATCC 700264 / AMB-1) TaxID=342108 RepID=Q2VZE0_PARM1|nr:hypothetical protein [Paramagnetospirillum magneticum]BAE53035.1 hypothetical protein amb4231 [Paramagnetospirillum magneticum AMB-1]